MEAYSGWGGAQKAFSEKAEGEWVEIRDRLKELLSEDEFASQRHTVLTAFYTPAPVIGAIYDALREVGIGQGDTPAAILEPGCGTGNFMRLAPADLALDFHGVELDPISARIAQALCPEAHITAAGLEECRVSPASFDAAIGNVPYSGDIKIDGMPIHDYFIKKSVEAVRPGGIVAVLTSRYTLDKNSTATRRALAEQAELLGAVRLRHRLDQLAGAHPPRARGLRRPAPDRAGGLRRATLERLHRQPAARPARPRAGQLPFRGRRRRARGHARLRNQIPRLRQRPFR